MTRFQSTREAREKGGRGGDLIRDIYPDVLFAIGIDLSPTMGTPAILDWKLSFQSLQQKRQAAA